MHIILNHTSMVPIYEQLMDQIKNAIIQGDLKDGDPLPSVRSLSNQLKISALTVKKAYDRLEEERFVKTIHGKGTFVLATNREMAKEAHYKYIEDELSKVIERAKNIGMKNEELMELVQILLEESL